MVLKKEKKEYFESYRIVRFTTISRKGLKSIMQQMFEKYTVKWQQLQVDRMVLLRISHIRIIRMLVTTETE